MVGRIKKEMRSDITQKKYVKKHQYILEMCCYCEKNIYNLNFVYGTIPTCLVAIETFCFSGSFNIVLFVIIFG